MTRHISFFLFLIISQIVIQPVPKIVLAGPTNSSLPLIMPPILAASTREEMITLVPEKIAGPGTGIVYKGKTYTTPLKVPANKLVGIIKNNKGYLYHPSMGENITLSESTSKEAFTRYWFGPTVENAGDVTKLSSSGYSSVAIGKTGGLADGQEITLGTGVTVKRHDPTITLINNLARWVAVKVWNGSSQQVYYLAPAGFYLDSSMIRTLGDHNLISHPLLDVASGQNIRKLPTSSVRKIETFGAMLRVVPVASATGTWPAGITESWNLDSSLVKNVNRLDTMHFLLEMMGNIANTYMLPCLDLFSNMINGAIQTAFISYMTGDKHVTRIYGFDSAYDLLNSMGGCFITGLTGGAAAVVFEIWERIVEIDHDIENVMAVYSILQAHAFAGTELSHPSCDDTTAEQRTAYIGAHIIGPKNANVSYQYLKIYCDGSIGGPVGPYQGTTSATGHYYSSMLGSFKIDNQQDRIIVKATVNGISKEVAIGYGRASFGINPAFPEWVEVRFP